MLKVINNAQGSHKRAFEEDPSDLRRFYREAPWHQRETLPTEAIQSVDQEPIQETLVSPLSIPSIGQQNPHQLSLPHIRRYFLTPGRTTVPLYTKLATITSNPWVLQVVQGYQIEWIRIPFQLYPAIICMTSRETFQPMAAEVENLLQKQAVVAVTPCEDQFISGLLWYRRRMGHTSR